MQSQPHILEHQPRQGRAALQERLPLRALVALQISAAHLLPVRAESLPARAEILLVQLHRFQGLPARQPVRAALPPVRAEQPLARAARLPVRAVPPLVRVAQPPALPDQPFRAALPPVKAAPPLARVAQQPVRAARLPVLPDRPCRAAQPPVLSRTAVRPAPADLPPGLLQTLMLRQPPVPSRADQRQGFPEIPFATIAT